MCAWLLMKPGMRYLPPPSIVVVRADTAGHPWTSGVSAGAICVINPSSKVRSRGLLNSDPVKTRTLFIAPLFRNIDIQRAELEYRLSHTDQALRPTLYTYASYTCWSSRHHLSKPHLVSKTWAECVHCRYVHLCSDPIRETS